MASAYKLRCPGCGDVFRWTGKQWPKFCPLCGFSTALPERSEIQAPLIGNPKHKSGDETYRAYEKATEESARAAAEMAGVPEAEMASLKVTNFDTQQRQGDLAVKPAANPVSTFMGQNQQLVQQMQSNAMGYAAAAHTGKDAYAGARALSSLRAAHERIGSQVVLAGQKVVKGEQPSVPPMLSQAPTKEVLDRSVRSGGKVTF